MLKGKSLLNYRNLFSPNGYEKNDKIILAVRKMKKLYCVICGKYRKFEKPKISYLLSITCSNCKNKDEKIFKEEDSIEILKNFGSIENIYNCLKNMAEENISP